MTRERAREILNDVTLKAGTASMDVAVRAILAACEEAVREERKACADECSTVAAQYPTDVFPEDGNSVDCSSARMARVVAALCVKAIEARKP